MFESVTENGVNQRFSVLGMFCLGTIPLISPLWIAMAQLYKLSETFTGAPTTIKISSESENEIILLREVKVASISLSLKNKSSQV